MSPFEKSMSEVFDVAPKVEKIEKVSNIVEVKQNIIDNQEKLDDDLAEAYEKTKSNLEEIIQNGKLAMDEILIIARESQHPRSFEVYGGLLKNVVDANKELLAVQEQMRNMNRKNDNNGAGGTTIDKAIFIGSTSELSKLIKGNNL